MNRKQTFGSIDIAYDTDLTGVVSMTVTFHGRSLDSIIEAVNAKIQTWNRTMLVEPADKLSHVQYYRSLRNKDSGIAAEMARIEIDRQQIEIDHRRACADLDGERLAVALAKIDQKRRAITERIDTCAAGKQAFQNEVGLARRFARQAIIDHLKEAMPKIAMLALEETKKATDEVTGLALMVGAPLLALIDRTTIAAELMERLAVLGRPIYGQEVTECPLVSEALRVLDAVPLPVAEQAHEAKSEAPTQTADQSHSEPKKTKKEPKK